jgi:hypothetical protein
LLEDRMWIQRTLQQWGVVHPQHVEPVTCSQEGRPKARCKSQILK